MELFDTHAHFQGDKILATLSRAKESGVNRIIAVGGSEEMNDGAILASKISKENESTPQVFTALGWDRDQLTRNLAELDLSNCVAIGEIGLDYFYEPETRREQQAHFARQLEIAKEKNLPVIIHTRAADDDTIGVLKEIPTFGVIHCFTGNAQFCRALLDLGFYISISGIVTFKSADNVRESALIVPDDRLLIETDAPFLAPVPKRGNENESAFLIHTAEFLAKLRSCELEKLAAFTTANARQLFRC